MKHEKILKRAKNLISSLGFLTIAISGCNSDMGVGSFSIPKLNYSVVITSPSADTTIAGEVWVQVAAGNNTRTAYPNSSIESEAIWVDGSMVQASVLFPWNCWLTTEVKNGRHIIQAEAVINNEGAFYAFWSAPDTVIVRN